MATEINILSFNSTGLDKEKVIWLNNLVDILKIDIWCLQEHFKSIKTVDSWFQKNFNEFESFVKAGIRDNDTGAGRPKGGLAQFVRKSCRNIKKQRIHSKNWRIQSQIISIEEYKLLLCNVYMPTDPQTQIMDEEELLSTLDDLENIFRNSTFDDVICAGDWNYFDKRNTRFTRIIDNFLAKNNLVSAWSEHLADYTYQHNDLKSFSTIDHFMVTERFLAENVVSAAPVHWGDCRSNHEPIMMKIRIPENIYKEKQKSVPVVKTNWKKADENDIEEYAEMLDSLLSVSPPPASIACQDVMCQDPSHSQERDLQVVEMLEKIVQASSACIPTVTIDTNRRKQKMLPGWVETVLPAKKDALFWHSIWISFGKPTTGTGLYNVMRWTRNKYKYAVRKCKREDSRLHSEALGSAAEASNNELFKEMKKHLGSKKGSGQQVPDSLEGAVTKPDIVAKFRECYMQMYNCADRTEQLEDIKLKIQSLIRGNIPATMNQINRINSGVVRAAAEMMKPGKQDVHQQYSSDVFIHCPEIVYDQLSDIFKSFLIHGTMPLEILACAFMPLYKGNFKDQRKFSSYRALAGASQLLKLFEYVVLLLWGDLLSTDSLQYGFKRQQSCEMASWVVLEVSNFFIKRGQTVFGACMDLSAAFDNLAWDKMFSMILEKGVPAVVVRVFIYAYQEQKGWVRLAGSNSDTFGLSNGSRQGSILSPFYFAVYLDRLVKILRNMRLGCHVLGVWVGAVLYADDVFLLAPNHFVLQKMVTVAEEYATEHNLTFSPSKTMCIIFRGSQRVQPQPPVMLNGKPLQYCQTVTHLGHVLHESGKMDSDADRARGSFNRRATDIRDQLYFSWPSTKCRAINLNACDAYGLVLHELSSDATQKVFRAWNTQCKQAWSIPASSHISLLEKYFCSDLISLRRQVYSRYPGFVKKLLNSTSHEVRFLANIGINDQRSVLCRNIRFLNEVSKINVMIEPKWKLREAMPFQSKEEPEPWRMSLLTTLLSARINKTYSYLNMTYKQLNDMIDSLCSS